MELSLKNNECLRLKIIERLLKEGSTAEEPINISLTDYSSAEGNSSSSDNEGKSFKEFPRLEKLSSIPFKVPWSPEFETELRRFRYCRMRKAMQALDRIYFQPLFHKKCRFLLKKNPSTIKKRKRKIQQKEIDSGKRPKASLNFDTQSSYKKVDVANTVTLRYIEPNLKDSGSSTSDDALEKQKSKKNEKQNEKQNHSIAKREAGGQEMDKKKQLVKVSRKLRLWLSKYQIFILRRKMRHNFKLGFKSLYRRKKGERLLYDMPTTDPGNDLIFSTDDENIDVNGAITCYGKILPRSRRHLLSSELQRRYLDEIGDGLKNMPPELIISPSNNKGKQITYQPATTERYGRSSQRTKELPYIRQSAVRTTSWQSLNSAKPSLILYKPGAAKNKTQSPLYRPMSRKEILSKEDLNIKLSLKKKIWTGVQPDDTLVGIDRTRPLSWMASHSARGKKMMAEQNLNSDLNYVRHSSRNYIKRLENEAFLSASNRKIMEWQILNPKTDNSPYNQNNNVPDIKEDHNNYTFKHLTNMKTHNEISSVKKPKRTAITKVVKTSKILSKISKSRNNMLTSYRAPIKQPLNQHKTHVRSNKLKTGAGLVVTAVQTGVRSSISGVKKNKKQKFIQHKLPHSNSCNTNSPENEDPRRLATHNNSSNDNKPSVVMAASATNIVRKVKTKLKKKKSSSVKCNL